MTNAHAWKKLDNCIALTWQLNHSKFDYNNKTKRQKFRAYEAATGVRSLKMNLTLAKYTLLIFLVILSIYFEFPPNCCFAMWLMGFWQYFLLSTNYCSFINSNFLTNLFYGAKYLFFFSPLVPSKREKYIPSLSQYVCLNLYIFVGSVFTFQFLNDEKAKWIFLT